MAALFLTTALAANAQISKGSLMVGGSLLFSNQNSEYQNGTVEARYFSIAPQVGIAVKENLVAGVLFSYGGNRSDNGPLKQSYDAIEAGAFLRRYMGLGKSFYLFGEGGLKYAGNTQNSDKDSPANVITKNRGVELSLTPGVAYAVNGKLHLEASINSIATVNFNRQTRNEGGQAGTLPTRSNNFYLRGNASPSAPIALGVRLFFAGK